MVRIEAHTDAPTDCVPTYEKKVSIINHSFSEELRPDRPGLPAGVCMAGIRSGCNEKRHRHEDVHTFTQGEIHWIDVIGF